MQLSLVHVCLGISKCVTIYLLSLFSFPQIRPKVSTPLIVFCSAMLKKLSTKSSGTTIVRNVANGGKLFWVSFASQLLSPWSWSLSWPDDELFMVTPGLTWLFITVSILGMDGPGILGTGVEVRISSTFSMAVMNEGVVET